MVCSCEWYRPGHCWSAVVVASKCIASVAVAVGVKDHWILYVYVPTS